MKKIMNILLAFVILASLFNHNAWCMGKKAADAASSTVDAANSLGTNDGAQYGAEKAGKAIAEGGKTLVNQAYEFGNNNPAIPQSKVNEMANNGTRVFAGGKAIEYAGKGASHVDWASKAAGQAWEGDYAGAGLEAANGITKNVAVGTAATAAGTWAAGKVGAMAGSWGGPLGAAAGFVIGCGAAWVGGKIWDNTMGKGKDYVGQEIRNVQTNNELAGPKHASNRSPEDVARAQALHAERIAQQQAAQQARQAAQARPRPPVFSGGGGGGGGCRCP